MVKKKILWLLVSSLMSLSLVMAACAPAAVEEEEEKAPVTEEKAPEQKVEEEVVVPTGEKPKYGGVLKVGYDKDVTDFDGVVGMSYRCYTSMDTNESLWSGDWAKGPAGGYGSNKTDWTLKIDVWANDAGYIAESWEIPNKIEGETGTIIYHIRKGVHFGLNPASEASRLVGGRELTADDVVFCLNQAITNTRGYIYGANPVLRACKITSPEPWTVKVEFPWEAFEQAVGRFGEFVHMAPPEVMAKYGNMGDWKNSVGTGPFILTDFVSGSTATLVRNPNYWMKDPVGPGKGNQLPYVDGVRYLIISDTSTRLAAIRTAKIDQFGGWGGGAGGGVFWEDAAIVKKTTPQLMSSKIPPGSCTGQIGMKIDRAPFNDIRVRRALMMAIDWESIKNDLYGGEAYIVTFPTHYTKDFADAYYGLDEQGQWPSDCPESIKELYSYNPEKARTLLKEAGYPQGFKTNVIFENVEGYADYYSIYKDMWSKVGIDCELQPKERVAFYNIKLSRDYDQMLAACVCNLANVFQMVDYHGTSSLNISGVDDPVVGEAYPKIQSALVEDRAEANRLYKQLMKYILDQVWVIPRVTPPAYSLYWPWIKNYSGEVFLGYARHCHAWVWLDQELKKSMGY